jgi:hypothetical protein
MESHSKLEPQNRPQTFSSVPSCSQSLSSLPPAGLVPPCCPHLSLELPSSWKTLGSGRVALKMAGADPRPAAHQSCRRQRSIPKAEGHYHPPLHLL